MEGQWLEGPQRHAGGTGSDRGWRGYWGTDGHTVLSGAGQGWVDSREDPPHPIFLSQGVLPGKIEPTHGCRYHSSEDRPGLSSTM